MFLPCNARAMRMRAQQRVSVVQGQCKRGEGMLHMGSISRESSPPATQTCGNGQHTRGAMNELRERSTCYTHPTSGVVMDLAAFKFCHSIDNDATAIHVGPTILKSQAPTPASGRFKGQLKGVMAEMTGQGRSRAHPSSIAMDIASFKVSHSTGRD